MRLGPQLGMALLLSLGAVPARPASPVAPFDLWTPEVTTKMRDERTLAAEVIPHDGYSEVFYDSEVSDDVRRQRLYDGQLFVYSPRPSILALTDVAKSMIEDAFGELDPRTAQKCLRLLISIE